VAETEAAAGAHNNQPTDGSDSDTDIVCGGGSGNGGSRGSGSGSGSNCAAKAAEQTWQKWRSLRRRRQPRRRWQKPLQPQLSPREVITTLYESTLMIMTKE